MKHSRLLAVIPVTLVLSHCANSVRPYSDKREQSRTEVRDVQQTAAQFAFEDGKQAGQTDRAHGDPDNYRRHSPMYAPATERAYADGYREGYGSASPAEPARDAVYNQGFDYGMRDRARQKPRDPEAHVGEYDAASRASFDQGYLDGYNR